MLKRLTSNNHYWHHFSSWNNSINS